MADEELTKGYAENSEKRNLGIEKRIFEKEVEKKERAVKKW